MGFLYIRQLHHEQIPWSERLQLCLLGVLGIGIYNVSLNYGELTVSAGVASFVIGLSPAMIVLVSVIFLGERPQKSVYFGIVVSLIGLGLIVAGGGNDAGMNYGVFIIFIAALASVGYSLLQKRYLKHYHPVAVTSWIIWGGTLSMMIFAPALWREIPMATPGATLAIIYLGIFPAALAYLVWSYVLQALSASHASLYLYSMPVISSLLGFIVLHEKPTLLSFFGGCLAMVGAFYASRGRITVES
jgi:drug/metabolite transporter (DMT)-like permease